MLGSVSSFEADGTSLIPRARSSALATFFSKAVNVSIKAFVGVELSSAGRAFPKQEAPGWDILDGCAF